MNIHDSYVICENNVVSLVYIALFGAQIHLFSALMNQVSEQSPPPEVLDLDPIWTTSRTARQIHALGEVEKVSASRVSFCSLFDVKQ